MIEGFPFLQDLQAKRRADERTRTAFPCSLRVIGHALQGCAGGCNAAYLGGFLCPGLPCVAVYCAPGGIKVVSTDREPCVAAPQCAQPARTEDGHQRREGYGR